jgi:thymidylate synthase ThyX
MIKYKDLQDFLFNTEIDIATFDKYLKPLYNGAGIQVDRHVRTINKAGKSIDSYIVHIPKFLSAELITHQVLKFNGASTRAIPTSTMVDDIPDYIPPVFFKNCKGMAGKMLIEKENHNIAIMKYNTLMTMSKAGAEMQSKLGLHKQHIRMCEPYKMTTYIITGTEWHSFFKQRADMAAQPEFIALALLMQESKPDIFYDEIHLPFGYDCLDKSYSYDEDTIIKANIALAAKISYRKTNGKINIEDAEYMYNILINGGHLSPFNHIAHSYDSWSVGFDGWQSERVKLFGDAITNKSIKPISYSI